MPYLSQSHIDRILKATGELEKWIGTLPDMSAPGSVRAIGDISASMLAERVNTLTSELHGAQRAAQNSSGSTQ